MATTMAARSRRAARRHQRGFWNYVIPAVASLAGGILGGRASAKGQEEANEKNVGLSREQMEFQERMSSTSYQRAVKDMQAAGLSPMLAYSQGGASAPTGSMATMQNPNVQLGQNIASSAGQAMQIAQAATQMQQTEQNTRLQAAQEAKVRSETMAHDLNSAKLIADTEHTRNAAKKTYEEIIGSSYDSMRKQMEFRANMDNGDEPDRLRKSGFAADVQRRKAEARTADSEALIRRYGVDEAKASSEFFKHTGEAPKWIQLLMHIARGFPLHR